MPARSATKTQALADPLCCVPLTQAPLSVGEAEDLAPVLAALGDPVCRRLLSTAGQRSLITLGYSPKAGLIVGDRQGKRTWWRVVPERLSTLRHVFGGS